MARNPLWFQRNSNDFLNMGLQPNTQHECRTSEQLHGIFRTLSACISGTIGTKYLICNCSFQHFVLQTQQEGFKELRLSKLYNAALQTTRFTSCARDHFVGSRARPRSPRVVDARQTGRLFGRAQRGDLRQIDSASTRGFRMKTAFIVRCTINFG